MKTTQFIRLAALFVLGILHGGLAMAENEQWSEKLKQLPDLTQQMNEMNFAPGTSDEQKMLQVAAGVQNQNAFIVKIAYRHVVGQTKAGAPISGGPVFVVNPSRTTGVLSWKKPKYVRVDEPHWTLFKADSVDFPTAVATELQDLFR